MFHNLTPWEGRLALLFALALATAFTAGCENPPGCVDGDCAGDDDAQVDDDDDDAEDFSATLHIVVPYGWVGYVGVNGELEHSNVTECDVEVDEPGTYVVGVGSGDTWTCVPQSVTIDEDDSGKTFVLDTVWEGTGVCNLTPDGTYGVFDVDSGAGWIEIAEWGNVTATGDTFFGDNRSEDGGILLEGEIAEDLSWIYYHRVSWNGEESEATLPLMDE